MTTTTVASAAIGRADRVVLLILAVGAATLGLVNLIHGALRARLYLIATNEGTTPLELLTEAELPQTHGPDPAIVTGGFTSAHLLASGLSDGARAFLIGGEILGALTGTVVAAAIAYLLFSLAAGRPFARPLYRLTFIAGATLSYGALLSQSLSGFGRMQAATELNDHASHIFTVGFTFDPTFVFIGFVVMALAFVFRAGARLQRDTEGLV